MKGEQPLIAYPADIWLNSQLSVARYSGGCTINHQRYYVMEQTDDLVRSDFVSMYNQLGRQRFFDVLANADAPINTVAQFRAALRVYAASKQQINHDDTEQLELPI
jgi:hypothetical protein